MKRAQKMVGASVRAIRNQRGLTLEGLAQRAGITYQYLSAIENGRENFSIQVIERISHALRLSLGDLCVRALRGDGAARAIEPPLSDLVIGHMREGVIVTDAEFHVLQANSAFADMIGCDVHELLGRIPDFLQSGGPHAALVEEMRHAVDRHGHWSGTVHDRRRSGEAYAAMLEMIAVAPHAGTAARNYLGIFTEPADVPGDADDESRIGQDGKPGHERHLP
ncbi:MAG: helix-turn-helix domain-containing protein [Gammaproteobacteria bacterium]|nr:helix-turn-helix domain-containing protein [Gammaproteobacteria bacterium]